MRGVYKEIAPTFKNRGRSIPTRVGFARSWGSGSLDRTVHSHACGVYRQIKTVVDNVVGPSPRTWSLRLYSCSILHHPRSIPTYVGFTYAAFSIGTATTVYPHMRGVYGQRQRHHRARSRSIPACVGFISCDDVDETALSGPSPRM